jgi:hypothetical protein
MFICLLCFQEPAWKSVLVCTMTCWVGWSEENSAWHKSLGRLIVATGVAWSSPPWHSLPFLAASFVAPPKEQWPSHALGSTVAGSLLATLCVYGNVWLPAMLAAGGVLVSQWEPGIAAAIITVAWAIAASEGGDIAPYISVATAPLLYWPEDLVKSLYDKL